MTIEHWEVNSEKKKHTVYFFQTPVFDVSHSDCTIHTYFWSILHKGQLLDVYQG
jgi:hypothetical protein